MAIEKKSLSPLEQAMTTEETLTGDAYVMSEFDNGDLEFDFSEDSLDSILNEGAVNYEAEHFENLADTGEDSDLKQKIRHIGLDVQDRFEGDKQSRAKWLSTVNQGLSLLGTNVEETSTPFPGACSAHHPLILESAVKFQAKASNELFNPKGPVKTAVVGKPDEAKEAQAVRVKNHMNYQVMYQMEEYFDESELLLFYLPIVGSAFKKTYYDSLLDRPCSVFVPVDQFVVNYYATNLKTAACYTHVIQRSSNDLKKDIQAGLYRDVDLGLPNRSEYPDTQRTIDDIQGFSAKADDEVYTLLEQYCFLDIPEIDDQADEDGIALPYVVTVENETGTVLSIRRNWAESDDLRTSICPFTHYKFVPGMGFYGLGYIHLLGNLQMTLTAAMRSLVDSGTFANLQGGFVDKRLRIRNNDGPVAPGEFKEVEAGGLELAKAIHILPFKEPSRTLLEMYQLIEGRSQKFADSAEQVIADSTNYGPVGTTIALLEASNKFFSGVHKRLHKAQKNEFKLLAALNYEYLGESESFDTVGASFEISKNDYDGRVDVVPVSDPNMGSQTQKMTLAQAVYTAALQAPSVHDAREVAKYYYESLGLDEAKITKLVPDPEQPQQADPISDLKMAQQGKPIAAFPGQDHDAHIAIKTAFLQDPQSGGNPAMQPVIPRIQANIQEHIILKFQEAIAGTAAQSPKPNQPGMEQAIVTQAAQKVAAQNQEIAKLKLEAPDAARMKLADAEVMRVTNEARKLEADMQNSIAKNTFDALKLELDKYKTDMQLTIAQLNAQTQTQQTQMKEMMDLLKESMQIKAAAEQGDKQLANQQLTNEKSLKAKGESDKMKAESKAKPKTPKE
jgi:hypothetical protein